jgi:tRNA pseudouridine38-40 synthase
MVRNIMGCLVAVGTGARAPQWVADVLASRRREAAAPTHAAAGLHFMGPYYDPVLGVPEHTPAMDWIP